MAAKPPFRELDEIPARGDDIKITLPWFKYEGSGRLLALLLIAAGLFAVSIVATGYMYAHDTRTAVDHATLVQTIEVQTCVLTLNELERREFRTEGKYCGGHGRRGGVNFRDDGTERDERQRFSATK